MIEPYEAEASTWSSAPSEFSPSTKLAPPSIERPEPNQPARVDPARLLDRLRRLSSARPARPPIPSFSLHQTRTTEASINRTLPAQLRFFEQQIQPCVQSWPKTPNRCAVPEARLRTHHRQPVRPPHGADSPLHPPECSRCSKLTPTWTKATRHEPPPVPTTADDSIQHTGVRHKQMAPMRAATAVAPCPTTAPISMNVPIENHKAA